MRGDFLSTKIDFMPSKTRIHIHIPISLIHCSSPSNKNTSGCIIVGKKKKKKKKNDIARINN